MSDKKKHTVNVHSSEDGSHTLYSERYRQYFHNPNGAIAESRHVFFDTPGLWEKIEKTGGGIYNIFEAGFGTGLNICLVSELLEQLQKPVKVNFYSVEKFPVSPEQILELNYGEILGKEEFQKKLTTFWRSLQPGWNSTELEPSLSIHLYYGSFDRMPVDFSDIHSIFFDPFSPNVNPEFWTLEVFEKLGSMSHPDVVLSTYGAATAARAAMAAAGWHTARAPGALGKREMTVAALNPELLTRWTLMDREKMAAKYKKPD